MCQQADTRPPDGDKPPVDDSVDALPSPLPTPAPSAGSRPLSPPALSGWKLFQNYLQRSSWRADSTAGRPSSGGGGGGDGASSTGDGDGERMAGDPRRARRSSVEATVPAARDGDATDAVGGRGEPDNGSGSSAGGADLSASGAPGAGSAAPEATPLLAWASLVPKLGTYIGGRLRGGECGGSVGRSVMTGAGVGI